MKRLLLLILAILLVSCTYTHIISETRGVNSAANSVLQDEQQIFWAEKAESFYQLEMEITYPLNESEIINFFYLIIADNDFYDSKVWKNADSRYKIPLKDIENILYTHLDIESIDIQMFGERYNSDEGALILEQIGGFGGSRATELISYDQNENLHIITIGSYNMEKYFSETKELELIETYELVVEISSDSWKIVSAVIK